MITDLADTEWEQRRGSWRRQVRNSIYEVKSVPRWWPEWDLTWTGSGISVIDLSAVAISWLGALVSLGQPRKVVVARTKMVDRLSSIGERRDLIAVRQLGRGEAPAREVEALKGDVDCGVI